MITKVTDEQIIEQIDKGLNTSQILKFFNLATSGTSYKRINKLRKLIKEPEVHTPLPNLFDTLSKGGNSYRVVEITEEDIIVKPTVRDSELPAWLRGKQYTIPVDLYTSGKSGYHKRDLPPVTCYTDDSLKNVLDEQKLGHEPDPHEETEKAQPDSKTSDLSELGTDPAYEFDKPAHKESFTLESKFRAELDLYDDARQRIMDRLVDELPLDAEDLNTYSRVVERYGGES